MKTPIMTLAALAVLALHTAQSESKILANVDKSGVGVQGYDPTAFFTEGRPVKGDPSHASTYRGVTYHFASSAAKVRFDAGPADYEPQFGGYCAYGVSRGSASPIQVEAFQIVDGRLLLQYSGKVRDLFNADAAGNLKLADEKWPALVEKKGQAAR